MQKALQRHVRLRHPNEDLVTELVGENNSKKRDLIMSKIRGLSMGITNKSQDNTVRTARGVRCRMQSWICSNCNLFFAKRSYYCHRKRCGAVGSIMRVPVLQKTFPDEQQEYLVMLNKFRQDEIGLLCRNDKYIRLFGSSLFKSKSGGDEKDQIFL